VSSFYKVHPGGSKHITLREGKDLTSLLISAPHPHSEAAIKWLESFKVEDENTLSTLPKIDADTDLDWDKGMLWNIHKVEKYEDWVWTPTHRPLKLFDSDTLDNLLTYNYWYMVPIVLVPVSLWALKNCYEANNGSFAICTALLVAGFLLWEVLEYTLHQHLFHLKAPDHSFWRKIIQFTIHGLHHKVPFDPARLVFPPVPAAILTKIIWSICRIFVPLQYAWGVLSGGLIGYMFYDLTHYYLHHEIRKKVPFCGVCVSTTTATILKLQSGLWNNKLLLDELFEQV